MTTIDVDRYTAEPRSSRLAVRAGLATEEEAATFTLTATRQHSRCLEASGYPSWGRRRNSTWSVPSAMVVSKSERRARSEPSLTFVRFDLNLLLGGAP
jgi:hypothetical protein